MFSILLKHYQLYAYFPSNLNAIPDVVYEFLEAQTECRFENYLDLDANNLDRMLRRYYNDIRLFLGICKFDYDGRAKFCKWAAQYIFPEALNAEEVDDNISNWFLDNKFEMPRPKVLSRLVGSAEKTFEESLFNNILCKLSLSHKNELNNLLATSEGYSEFSNLRSETGAASLANVLDAISRLSLLRKINLPKDLLSELKPNLIEKYRLRASSEDAWELRRHPELVRLPLLSFYTHGQSIIAFAFCYLLGFDLMPRFKGIDKQKLVRPSQRFKGDFPNIDNIFAKSSINWSLMVQQYDEMIKLATALLERTSDAEAILRRFVRGQNQHPVYAALLELGKAAKTLFLCRYLSSKTLRREINTGLNVVERWNGVNNFIYFGKGGEFSTNRLEEQEVSVLSLHLLQSSMVYVNTLMIQNILAEPLWKARMTERDIAALSPLPHSHFNPYGKFDLDMSTHLSLEEMRIAA
ncbi:MAG: Tn3 family transposase [Alphaproteobacteria bacterium]|nr:Tn3 family transposase [Alphaproteobacteria bacterium]